VIAIGVDAHKGVHVALAVDEAGQELGQWQGLNSAAGWQAISEWAASLGSPRQWGIEGAWGYGRNLAQHLVPADETVYEVNPRWTAMGRRSARKRGKTDRLDARAVALLVRQEASALPRVHAEDDTAVLDLLTSEREAAMAESIRLRNQIHALLLQTDPEYRAYLPTLKSQAALDVLESYTAASSNPLHAQRAAAIRRLALRLRLVLSQAEELAQQIRDLARGRYSPLIDICGINLITAGTLAGILGPGHRFATDAQLAAYAGVAPLETSSAGLVRHRLNRGGNRRLNAVLYRIVLTQAHHLPAAKAYIERRLSEGKTRREAHRALRRFVIRAISRGWQKWQPAEPALSLERAA
jgi:transposase